MKREKECNKAIYTYYMYKYNIKLRKCQYKHAIYHRFFYQ